MVSTPHSSETLTGVLERIIFFNEENHYTIAELKPEAAFPKTSLAAQPADPKSTGKSAATVTITGPLPGVQCGETLQLTGEWTRHAQHGAQFKITSYKSQLPSSVYGIRKYLGSGLVPGIGKVYANKIVDAFGTDTFRILSEESGKLRKVEGIGKVRAASIKSAWEEQKTLREVHIFLQMYGVTTSQCVRIVKKLGSEAQQIVKNEPYRIAREIDGIGFKTADRIAINLGFANDAPPRLDAGIIYALQTLEEEGHTAYPRGELVTHTANLLETSADRIEARIDALIKTKDLVQHPVGPSLADAPISARRPAPALPNSPAPQPVSSGSQPSTLSSQLAQSAIVQLPHNDRAEHKIADVVRRLGSVPTGLPAIKIEAAIAWAQEKAGFEFHGLQKSALQNSLAHKFTILTGGPGTGKTTILRALVEILKAKKVRVTLAAPTGRAAQRLSETTGGFATTIHRLLAYDVVRGGFAHNESKPLPTDFLIVDESSMLDVRLAAALLQAVPVRAHLLLVGDVDQLPSVGAGNVLKDFIATECVPVTRLSFVYRQQKESLIVATAHAINGGEHQPPPIVSEVAKAQAWSDLNFISATSAEDCLAKVIELCTKFIPQHFKWFNPVTDVQVLAPMHKGVAGVANLNAQLQAALNPHHKGLKAVSGEYRPGDKLIQLRNNYDKNLFNGDIGTIVSEVAKAQAWSDLNFISATSAEDCLAKVIELCTKFIPQHFKWFNPVTDVQILAPMHKGVAGVANLNVQLQAALNPHQKGLKAISGEYRPGDKLIQLRNNYDKNLFNGDIGTIVSVDLSKGTLIANFDGSQHVFERGEFGDVALAYAISIHKSQGSEYPVVIVPLLKAHFMMLQRNLLYTAITRGKKKVFLVGEPAAYAMAVRNSESKLRITHLREKIVRGIPA